MLRCIVQTGATNDTAVLRPGEKILLIHRPLFQGDARRHFIGVVLAVEMPLIRASGYVYAADPKTNQFRRHEPERIRVVALTGDSLIVNVIQPSVQIETVTYQYHSGSSIYLADGSGWRLDVSHL